jgi:hypothetical protein
MLRKLVLYAAILAIFSFAVPAKSAEFLNIATGPTEGSNGS